MSMGTQISAAFVLSNRAVAAKSRRDMSFRNLRWCLLWAALVVASAVGSYYANNRFQLPAVIFFVYVVQALIAEWMGVRVSLDRVSAPRRPFSLWPYAVFWRTQGAPSDIEGLTSVSAEGGGVVLLSWIHGAKIRLMFANRDRKLEFFEAVRRYRPNVRIFRES
jgi:hypothetical protein